MAYTIGITTFEHRFEKNLKPLLEKIKDSRPDLEVIIYVNAQISTGLSDEYRKNILSLCASKRSVYPITTPNFKGLSKMWNGIIVQSSNDNIFIFNDDVDLVPQLFEQIENLLRQENVPSFNINGSFSHFHVNRKEVFEVGFFDERLIGLGEEDGDWVFRWCRKYQKGFPMLQSNYIRRFEGYSSNLKETPWNTDWIFKNKYDPDNESLAISQGFPANGMAGMYGKPVAMRDIEDLDFYPAEKFIWEHISELTENFGNKNNTKNEQ